MKFISTFIKYLFLFSFTFSIVAFAESEPNNTYQQASPIGSNSADNGAMNEGTQTTTADNDDWWQVTLPSDGSFYCSTNASSNLDIDMYIYDVNGSTIIATGAIYGLFESIHHHALKAGTYFIRAYRAAGTGSYSILTRFTAAPYTIDPEPNDTYQTASALGLNSQSTGHIYYYSNGSTDYDDYWKVTIPYDGDLTVSVQSDTADIDIYMYDVNGESIIKSASVYGLSETIQHTHLMPGTYYIRLYATGGKQGGYTISSTYTQTSLNGITTNDAEKNDEYTTAVNWLTFNNTGEGNSYGHLGYFSNNYTDYDDYWAVTTTTDGKLTINIESNSTLDIDMYLYDINGSTIIKSAAVYGTTEEMIFPNLGAGKYYIRTYSTGGYGSYKITADFVIPSMSNDPEPNDDFSTATSISLDTKLTGHLGYFSNNHTDYDDYYVINLSSDLDSFYVRTDSEVSLDVDMYLYNNQQTILTGAYTYGTTDIIKYGKLTAGTYFIRPYKSRDQGSYAIMCSSHFIANPLTAVKENEITTIPTAYSLSQNFPNPFNPATTIKYSIPVETTRRVVFTTLKVYDILGNEVATLVNEEKVPGYYEVKFDASHAEHGRSMASGIYFYRIDAGSFTQTKKLLLMK